MRSVRESRMRARSQGGWSDNDMSGWSCLVSALLLLGVPAAVKTLALTNDGRLGRFCRALWDWSTIGLGLLFAVIAVIYCIGGMSLMVSRLVTGKWQLSRKVLLVVVVLVFAYCVWPTPWRYLSERVRVNRITGETQVLTSDGWERRGR